MSASEQTSASKHPTFNEIMAEWGDDVGCGDVLEWTLRHYDLTRREQPLNYIGDRHPDELELAVNSPSFVNPQLEDEVFSRQPDELAEARRRIAELENRVEYLEQKIKDKEEFTDNWG